MKCDSKRKDDTTFRDRILEGKQANMKGWFVIILDII